MQRQPIEHVAFYGATCSGKSTLARRFSRALRRRQIIFDPTNYPESWSTGWRPDRRKFFNWGAPAETQTDIYNDPNAFLAACGGATECDIIVDEAADIFFTTAHHAHPIITKGRHSGNRVLFCSQRPTMVSPTCRGQASIIFMFRLGRRDTDAVLADCGFSAHDIKTMPRAAGECNTIDLLEGKIHHGYKDIRGELGE